MASTDSWTTVRTTLPLPLTASTARIPILTQRLVLRALAPSDLASLHLLMTQPEVMQWTVAGRAHTTLAETQRRLADFLPRQDVADVVFSFQCAVCLRAGDDGAGELVGIGGVVGFNRLLGGGLPGGGGGHGWPELGYLFRKEVWGMGLATEFVRAFLGAWEDLPRAEFDIDVNVKSLAGGETDECGKRVAERLVATTEPQNGASGHVLQKCGFEQFDGFTEKHREDVDKSLDLLAFRYLLRTGGKAEQTGEQ